jgi:hypothetical protein
MAAADGAAADGDDAQPEGGGSRAEGDAIPDAAVMMIVSVPSRVKVEAPTAVASTAMAAAMAIALATTASATVILASRPSNTEASGEPYRPLC